MRVLVCGGREFANLSRDDTGKVIQDKRYDEYRFVHSYLDKLAEARSINFVPDDNWMPLDFFVIGGKARGADTAGIDWAVSNFLNFQEYPADWDKHGKKAGFIRNTQMLVEGKPDLVIAFPGGVGTRMMVDIAKKAGVEVTEVEYIAAN